MYLGINSWNLAKLKFLPRCKCASLNKIVHYIVQYCQMMNSSWFAGLSLTIDSSYLWLKVLKGNGCSRQMHVQVDLKVVRSLHPAFHLLKSSLVVVKQSDSADHLHHYFSWPWVRLDLVCHESVTSSLCWMMYCLDDIWDIEAISAAPKLRYNLRKLDCGQQSCLILTPDYLNAVCKHPGKMIWTVMVSLLQPIYLPAWLQASRAKPDGPM